MTGVPGGDTPSGTISYAYKQVNTFLFGLFEGYTKGLPKDAGKYEIKAQIAEEGNYKEAESTNVLKLTIEKSTPTLFINTMTGKTYDGTPVVKPTEGNMTIAGAAYADVKFAYSGSNDMSGSTQTPPTNAGRYYVQASIAASKNTAEASSVAVSFTITQAPLTADVTGTQTGTVLSYKWKTTDGIIGTDSATLAIPGAAVGNTITVDVTAANYSDKLTSTTATVAKKAVTATADTISKVYDGTNAVEADDQTLTIAKVNVSDDITVTMPNATYNDATVNANKAITVGTLTITGAAKDWCDVTAPSSVTGEITVKPLTGATVTVNGTYPYTDPASICCYRQGRRYNAHGGHRLYLYRKQQQKRGRSNGKRVPLRVITAVQQVANLPSKKPH